MTAIVLKQTPPKGPQKHNFSMAIIKTLPPSMPLEVWLEQRGYTHGYFYIKNGIELFAATKEKRFK